MKRFFAVLMTILILMLPACGGGGGSSADNSNSQNNEYTVTYDGNTNTSGSVPIDTNKYSSTFTVAVLDSGTLIKTGYTFAGWNTQADGNGTDRAPGSTFTMGASNVILYAKWTNLPTYNVTYNANTGSGGVPSDSNNYLAGATVTVLGSGTLTKTGYTFVGWNTQADGNGTDRTPGSTFAMGSSNVTLYAKWTEVEYAIGNTGPAGGLIFYDKGSFSNGWRYMEAALENAPFIDGNLYIWGTMYFSVPGADGTAIGTGKQNTLDISVSDDYIPNMAAKGCLKYSVINGGIIYDDWFLPSIDELQEMYTPLLATPGGFGGRYWSSSECSGGSAYTTQDNVVDNWNKNDTSPKVRCVRYF